MEFTWAQQTLINRAHLGLSEDCLLRLFLRRENIRWSWEAKDETGDIAWSYGDNYETLAEVKAVAVQWVETHYSPGTV